MKFFILSLGLVCMSMAMANTKIPAAKYVKLTQGKILTCTRQGNSTLNQYDRKDYGNFQVRVRGQELVVSGNPGDGEIMDYSVGEFLILNFGGSTGSTRFLAVIDSLNLPEGTGANLIQMDEGMVSRTTNLGCKLGK